MRFKGHEWGRRKNEYKILAENVKGRSRLEDISVDG
jgi:hypothetical protein